VLYILWAWRLCHHTDRVRLFPVVSVPFALLVVWSGLSFLWAPKPDYALYTLWGMVEVLFLYFYAANLVKSRDDLSFIVTCITVTVAISAIVAICQYATGSSFGLEFLGGREAQELLELQMPGISRAAGLLISANSLAWFLKLWLPLLLLWGIAGPHRISRSLCLVSFLLGLLALLVSFSRAGWLAFTFSLVLIAMWLMKRSFRKYLRGALPRFLVLGTIVVVLSIPFVPRVVERLSRDDYGAAYSRIPLAKVALNMIWHNPVIGVGMGNYKYVMGKYDNTPERITRITAQKIPLAVHNIYLMLAAELGIGALAIFVFISIAIFWQGLRTLGLRDKIVVLFVVAILAGLAAFYLQGMSDPGIIGSCKFRPFWFMAGAVLACSEGREEKLT